ncbi:TlpA disulfide reductase family protein [Tenacibaculum sp. IB213877]|uniref:TlpA family protein disulfide reductase n=1 Tax=Tenacibaculum sp. IB213877 TaxID=3097351 RepID=UPI002A59AD50|nr:TlpA disulfide reductase family protein [Tenacibaculum sp. IB213877]MDY0780149.1 TlpA disulfide reductase family protein [Tenacibaculum sp. IB213877]
MKINKIALLQVSLLLVIIAFTSCNTVQKGTKMPVGALQGKFLNLEEEEVQFDKILERYKGKKVFVEVCASWCKECILGLPHINKLKEKNIDAVFVFLSIDRNVDQWKRGIERFDIKGEHYYLPSALKGSFAQSLQIDKIPNYMVVNKKGEIVVSNISDPTDVRLKEALENN